MAICYYICHCVVGSFSSEVGRGRGEARRGRYVPEVVGFRGTDTSEDCFGGIHRYMFLGDDQLVFGEDGCAVGITEFANGEEVGIVQGWDDVGISGGGGKVGDR